MSDGAGGPDSGLALGGAVADTRRGGAGLPIPGVGVDVAGTPTGIDSLSGSGGLTNSGLPGGGSSAGGSPAAADVLVQVIGYAYEQADIPQVKHIIELIEGAQLEEISLGFRPIVIETSMLDAVRADIDSLGETKAGMPRATRALALWLAEAIDKVGTAAGPTQVARLAAELRGVLRVLAVGEDGGEDVDRAAMLKLLSTPERGQR